MPFGKYEVDFWNGPVVVWYYNKGVSKRQLGEQLKLI
jgi:uncharacterized protein (DUF3820 family)